jgi:hypothetical protein
MSSSLYNPDLYSCADTDSRSAKGEMPSFFMLIRYLVVLEGVGPWHCKEERYVKYSFPC